YEDRAGTRPHGAAIDPRPRRRGHRMRRRELLLLVAGAVTAPRALSAQQKAMPVIGFLGLSSPSASRMAAFCLGLGDTGYVKGQDVTIEYRWAEDRRDRLAAL